MQEHCPGVEDGEMEPAACNGLGLTALPEAQPFAMPEDSWLPTPSRCLQ